MNGCLVDDDDGVASKIQYPITSLHNHMHASMAWQATSAIVDDLAIRFICTAKIHFCRIHIRSSHRQKNIKITIVIIERGRGETDGKVGGVGGIDGEKRKKSHAWCIGK